MKTHFLIAIFLALIQLSCASQQIQIPMGIPYESVKPQIITDTAQWDIDDPGIWINSTHPEKSLIIGTDKNRDGGLYAFDLKGKIVNVVKGLRRPNNVDVAYGFPFMGETIDIAVVTERLSQRIRVFRLPEMDLIDNGDLIVFEGDTGRAPMGVAVFKRPGDNAFFILVGGKSGPEEGYIGQYLLESDSQGNLEIHWVREFGKFSGKKEIESIAVDAELGYVYYSDETVGVRKYHADPDVPNADRELAIFAVQGFKRDHEGISIYKMIDSTGYILVSDQQANRFWIYSREGSQGNPHLHPILKVIEAITIESDGSEVTSFSLPGFPSGMFVAMSRGKTLHYYNWIDIAGDDLEPPHHRDKKN